MYKGEREREERSCGPSFVAVLLRFRTNYPQTGATRAYLCVFIGVIRGLWGSWEGIFERECLREIAIHAFNSRICTHSLNGEAGRHSK